ncbi:MAG: YggS family pyridoxal phosphate-dependent enzyme [Verrucomicrobiales bacterium]
MGLPENFEAIKSRIDAACARAGREPGEVLLLPVTKGQDPNKIKAFAELGYTLFGENKVQEGKLKKSLCPSRFRWHMIGHLQSNKCKDALITFDMIQSVDSISLAEELNKVADKLAKHVPILLEVNIAGEATKYGFRPDAVLKDLEALNKLNRLEIHGLMTIAPYTPEPEKVRPIFKQLAELKRQCEEILEAPLQHLSMGMSGDFEVAIEEGATIVRIGTALFGPRQSLMTKKAEL